MSASPSCIEHLAFGRRQVRHAFLRRFPHRSFPFRYSPCAACMY
jgi:hypothetical protein